MTKEVVIKSNRYGINLILDAQLPFSELLVLIGEKFKESGSFFKDAQMAVSFEGRSLTAQEQLDIVEVITNNSAIRIVSIIDGNKELEELMKAQVIQAQATAAREPVQEPAAEAQSVQPPASFYKGNLRSGQILESEASVTLIGDVNPGATIISDGNIVILGSLKGNAYAGAGGDNNCFIFALDMKPIQLQIGELIAKSPDKEKSSRRGRKKSQTAGGAYVSQFALVRDGFICIEPMVKGCLDHLG